MKIGGKLCDGSILILLNDEVQQYIRVGIWSYKGGAGGVSFAGDCIAFGRDLFIHGLYTFLGRFRTPFELGKLADRALKH